MEQRGRLGNGLARLMLKPFIESWPTGAVNAGAQVTVVTASQRHGNPRGLL